MTRDDIVLMARGAGLVRAGNKWVEPARWGVTELVHFAALLLAAEREVIAKMVENWDSDSADPRDIADATRARGNT